MQVVWVLVAVKMVSGLNAGEPECQTAARVLGDQPGIKPPVPARTTTVGQLGARAPVPNVLFGNRQPQATPQLSSPGR
jgi:hypothetical protein